MPQVTQQIGSSVTCMGAQAADWQHNEAVQYTIMLLHAATSAPAYHMLSHGLDGRLSGGGRHGYSSHNM